MGNYTLLQRRTTGYYFRQIVPKDVRHHFLNREIVKSLQTNDLKIATSKHKTISKEIDDLISKLRNGESMESIMMASAKSENEPITKQINEPNSTKRGIGKTLTDAYDKWKDTVGNNKTREATELAIKRFEQANGKVLLGTIETSHAVDYKDWLEANTELKGRTVNKQIDHIKSLVSFAHSNSWIKSNPLLGLRIRASEKDSTRKCPFEVSDLEKLLLNDKFSTLRTSNVEYYWVTLIGLCTGCRAREICQLLVKDIKENKGIYYFDINKDDPGKTLKNKASIRKIPIHNELIRLGFLDYLTTLNSKPDLRIFSHLKEYDGNPSHYFCKWFSSTKIAMGIESQKSFHSFRHSAKDWLRETGEHKELHDRITGHSTGDVGDSYGKGFSIERLNQCLQKAILPIDLSRYHIKTQHRLNPAPHITPQHTPTSPPPESNPQVSGEDIMKSISMAEAYNRIGSKHYGEGWIPYEMIVSGNKYNMGVSFSRGHDQRFIIPPISTDRLAETPYETASKNDNDKHELPKRYLEKAVFSHNSVLCYYKFEDNLSWNILDEETKRNLVRHPAGIPLSACLLKDPKTGETKRIDLLINPESLTEFMDEHIYARPRYNQPA